jgi:transposase-like protein
LFIAGSVSLTFVFSELYSEPSNKGIKDAMMDNQISKAVLANSETELQLELSMEAFGNLRSDPSKRAAVVGRIEEGMTTRLLSFAQNAEYLLIGEPEWSSPKVQVHEEVPLLPAVAASRREYEQCKEELAEMLDVPRPRRKSRQKMAEHFGVPKSTLQDWVQKVRKETEEPPSEEAQSGEDPDQTEDVQSGEDAHVEEDQTHEPQAEETHTKDTQVEGEDLVLDAEVQELEEPQPDYADCKEELTAILRARPRANRQKLAEHFGVPREVLLDWIVQLRREVQPEDDGA